MTQQEIIKQLKAKKNHLEARFHNDINSEVMMTMLEKIFDLIDELEYIPPAVIEDAE